MLDPFLRIAIADIIDTVFVAILLYSAMVWAKKTRAALVVRGILILAAIYIIARQLDLQLTAWILQGFFAIFLIILVVIFQEELREIFERIAVWSLTSRAAPALRSEAVDVLVRTLADFTRDRTGALIVVNGKDPIERHITGGIEMGGKLSGPLLRSIFDPHSPGHDGAVIVEGDRISRFAVHLPLSKDFRQLSQVGTRHSAALGLAELTDALCIVVSEERGKISITRDSRLQELSNLQELGALLEDFLQEKFPSQGQNKIRWQILRENWVAKVVSLSLAITFWYVFVPGSKMIEVTHNIEIDVENLASNLEIEEIRPPEVKVTFTGPRRAFYLFDPKKLKVTVDASLAELGRRTFKISKQNVLYPKELTLQNLTPSTLKLSIKKLPRRREKNVH
ncbi:MAG: diadenylate cyclase [Candidatus Binatia bacterium]